MRFMKHECMSHGIVMRDFHTTSVIFAIWLCFCLVVKEFFITLRLDAATM